MLALPTKVPIFYSYILIKQNKSMSQIFCLEYTWTFKCHFCKKECHDPVEIGIHFLTHNYNLISDEELI